MKNHRCEKVFGAWGDYSRGLLADSDRKYIEDHLEQCAECARAYEIQRRLEILVDKTDLDPIAKRRMEVAISSGRAFAPRRTIQKWKKITWAAAAALIAISMGVVFYDLDTKETAMDERLDSLTTPPVIDQKSESIRTVATRSEPEVIELLSQTSIWLEAHSSVQIVDETTRLVRIRLQRGRILAKIDKQAPGFRFIVSVPSGEVEAKGTVFSVSLDEAGVETTRVIQGVVEVRHWESTAQYLVREGEQLSSTVNGPEKASELDLAYDLELMGVESTLPSEREGAVADLMPDLENSKREAQRSNRISKRAIDAIKDNRFNEAEQLLASAVEQNESTTNQIDILTRLARAYRNARQFESAVHTYQRLARGFPSSNAAINGLVALAQIEQESLGRSASALRHFELYLSRKPNGALAETARAGRIRALFRLGMYEIVILAADEYLSLHGNSVSSGEIRRKLEEARERISQ